MDVKDLYPFVYVIVLVSLVLGVGVLVFGNFGDAVRISQTVTNESVTFTAGVGALANSWITSVSFVGNQTVGTGGGGAIDFRTVNFSSRGNNSIWVNSTFSSTPYNVTYTYGQQSSASLIMSNGTSAVTPIATTWIPLIVTVASLAIILLLVIRSFGRRR